MRPLLASVLLATAAALAAVACSQSPDDDQADNTVAIADESAAAPDPSDAAEPASDAQAATASDSASVSFNAGQSADTDAWFTPVEGAGTCAANSTPAQAIQRLQALGVTPMSADTNAADGSLAQVVITWSEGPVQKSTAYYRSLNDCQMSLPSEQPVPEQYK